MSSYHIPAGLKPVVAEIDLSAIVHNCRLLRTLAGEGVGICAVVKSNAYGHGVGTILPALREAEVDMLSVATISEAAELRQLGWDKPILLLGSELSIYKGKAKSDAAGWMVENDVRITAMYTEDIDALEQAAEKCGKPAGVHLMLDTGMSRIGHPETELMKLADDIASREMVNIEGLYTHMAAADQEDKTFSSEQLARFRKFVKKFRKTGHCPAVIHMANSAALIDMQAEFFDMTRPGIAVYGYHPSSEITNRLDLKMSLKLKTFLETVKEIGAGSFVGYGCSYRAGRDMLIGVAGVGYGDGYDRGLSNKGVMKILDIEVPVIGKVTMNQTILDLTGLSRQGITPYPGMEVTVIDNNRDSVNNIERIAVALGTVPHEVAARLGRGIKRVGIRSQL